MWPDSLPNISAARLSRWATRLSWWPWIGKPACSISGPWTSTCRPSILRRSSAAAAKATRICCGRFNSSDSEEKEVRKAFRNPERLPKILIVTEKLLTGFDAPILYCMYLDKPMRDHVLLQAIARVNRPYEDDEGRAKPAGFVLDFVGIFDNLEKALAFDSQDVSGVVEGIDVLKGRFAELMEQSRKEYLPIVQGHMGDKAVEALLEHFRDKDRRQEFYQFFRETESVYEILSPDPFLRPFIDDYSELARFYNVLRACYERSLSVDKEFLRKTAQLVQQHTEAGTIQTPDKVHRLDSDTLEQIAGSGKPATVKIFNLLKALHDIVERDARQEPYLISIGDKAEQIAQAFEARQETTQKTLEELERLLAELRRAQQRRAETELSPEAFAVYWMLQRDGVEKAQDVAQAAAERLRSILTGKPAATRNRRFARPFTRP